MTVTIADAQEVSATTSAAGYVTGTFAANVDLALVSFNSPQSGSAPGGLIGGTVLLTGARTWQVRVFALASAPDAGSVQIVAGAAVTFTVLGLKVV